MSCRISEKFGHLEGIFRPENKKKIYVLVAMKDIAIPPTEEGIDVYLDKKSGDLYLTNFVYDQALLHHPINAISVFTDRIEIYLNEKNLDIPFHQTSRTLQTEIAFSELFLQDQTDERPKPKRRRLSKESQQDKKFTDTPIKGLSSSMSTELGVRTFQESPSSQSDFQPAHINSEFQTQESGEDSDDSIVPETEFSACSQQDDTVGMNAMGSGSDDSMLSGIGLSFSNKTLSDLNLKKKTFGEFPKSCLDQKTLKDQQVSIFAETLNDLLTKDKISEKEIIVSTAQLQLSHELEEEDVIIQRFTKELEESSEIKKFDPIVVIKNENYYNVISGTRRVAAYKSMQINKINVSEINAADGSKYRSCCFFRNMEKKKETNHSLLSALRDLFHAIQLSKRTAATWTLPQKNKVFGSLFQSREKLGQLLEIFLIPELEDEITKLSLAGLQISTRVLRTIFIKYKVNPKETILLLRKAWETENELRNELSRVIPCVRYILTEKKIEEYAINGLIEMFGNEPEFIDFVRKTDMRGITSSKQLHLLKAKYESHKEQSRSSSSRKTSKSTNINVSTIDVAHFEVLITANSINAQSIVSKKNTLLVLLIGQRIEKINQSILMLPDALGIPDEFGRINNHISVTILIKKEGHILNAFDTSDFLSSRGMPNRTVFSTDQLRQLASTFTKYYIDFGGALKADLITHLLTPSTTVFVSKTFYQNQLEKCMKEPGSDNTMQ
ncbi:hypothetical protein B9Z55_021300 [Caenorhabditis nigoni]|nr:hypothetical protein B9Z55_021300 [Caenorhabditis nigoni]